LWHKALEKYREELQAADDYQSIQKVHTLEELIDSFSSFQGAAPSNYAGVISLKRIAPRLKFIDDFSAILALCFGADTALTAAVWGSIRLILSHVSSAAETLKDVLDMLEDLRLTLPRLQVYEQTLPLNPPTPTGFIRRVLRDHLLLRPGYSLPPQQSSFGLEGKCMANIS
jgi:hypothetical protein